MSGVSFLIAREPKVMKSKVYTCDLAERRPRNISVFRKEESKYNMKNKRKRESWKSRVQDDLRIVHD